LLDEPFGALDELTRLEMNDLLLDIRRVTGATVLFVTHSISEAIYLSDQVVVFSKRPAVVARELTIDIPYPRSAKTRFLPQFTEWERQTGVALGLVPMSRSISRSYPLAGTALSFYRHYCRADASAIVVLPTLPGAKVDDRQCQILTEEGVGHRTRMPLWLCAVACDRYPYRGGDDLLTRRKPNVLSAAGGKPVDPESSGGANPFGLVRHRHSIQTCDGLRHRLFPRRRRHRNRIAFDLSRSP
jgi:hypothetical protein